MGSDAVGSRGRLCFGAGAYDAKVYLVPHNTCCVIFIPLFPPHAIFLFHISDDSYTYQPSLVGITATILIFDHLDTPFGDTLTLLRVLSTRDRRAWLDLWRTVAMCSVFNRDCYTSSVPRIACDFDARSNIFAHHWRHVNTKCHAERNENEK